MKKITIIVVLLSMILSLSSCENSSQKSNNEEPKEKMETEEEESPLGMFAYEEYLPQLKYEIILDPTKTEIMGGGINPFSAYHGELTIMEEHPVFGKQYEIFDDEMNYNDYVHEWMLASYLSILMVDRYSSNWENNKHKVEQALSLVGELPNTVGIEDPEIAEIFIKAYYDLKSLTIYMPNEKYGLKVFPLGKSGAGIRIFRQDGYIHTYHYVTLYRISGKEEMGIEDGALGIRLEKQSSREFLELLELFTL